MHRFVIPLGWDVLPLAQEREEFGTTRQNHGFCRVNWFFGENIGYAFRKWRMISIIYILK